MRLKKVISLAVCLLLFYLSILDIANAASIWVKCEVRGTDRSKISVKAAGLKGRYFARVASGGSFIQSAVKPVTFRKVEFDFDSGEDDHIHDSGDPVIEGATAIPATFIQGGKVLGSIRKAKTRALVGTVRAACRVRDTDSGSGKGKDDVNND